MDLETPLPARPDEIQGWGRLKRILTKHSTALVEVGGGFVSLLRALMFGLIYPPAWPIALAFAGVGLWQVYACIYNRTRWRSWAALATLIIVGITASLDLIRWQGYVGTAVFMAWVVVRGGPLFLHRKPNGNDTG